MDGILHANMDRALMLDGNAVAGTLMVSALTGI